MLKLFRNFWDKLRSVKKETWIRNSFLLPILLVVIISISHVVTWYDLGNPLGWAMYLSVAIEIFALASISAASISISRGSIWFLFSIVTFIQMVGNIFFEFNDIDVDGSLFKSWVELIQPLFEDWDMLDHRRFLAAIQGGSLPIMSLTALHFYIKSNEKKQKTVVEVVEEEPEVIAEPEPEKPKNVVDELTDESQPFWGGKKKDEKQTPPPPPENNDDDEDMAKYNPHE